MIIQIGRSQQVVGALLLAAACCTASAQDFNIDLDNTGFGAFPGGPSSNYGAALGQFGLWHPVLPPVGTPRGLVDIAGNRDTASVTVQEGALTYAAGHVLSPDGMLLWRDGYTRDSSLSLTFTGLANGNYTVAPIMWTAAETYLVQVTPSSDGIQIVNGTASDTFAQGSTHTIHHSVVVNGTMTVLVQAVSTPRVRIVGIQLRYCASSADVNNDGSIDFFDYLDFVDFYSAQDPSADFNNDGSIDFFDYLDFVDALSAGC